MSKQHLFLTLLTAAPALLLAETLDINGTQHSYEVLIQEQPAPGVTYMRLRLPDYPLNVNLVTADLSNPGCRVETWCANEAARGLEPIVSAATRLTTSELTPVAAANANFWHCYSQKEYPTYNLIPRLLSLRNGVLVTELSTGREKWDGGPGANGAVGITPDGHVYVDHFTPDINLVMPTREMNINTCNKGVSATYSSTGELGMYNAYYGRDTKFMFVEEQDVDGETKLVEVDQADATEVLLDIDEGQSWMASRNITFTVASVATNAAAGTLGNHDLALVARGSKKPARLAELKAGDKVTLNYSFQIADAGNITPELEQAVCGNKLVMQNGVLTTYNDTEDYNSMVYSRTGYGCSADNRTLYIIVIDKSTDPTYGKSAGCSTAVMCQIARHFGCDDMATFDAGGSAEMMYGGKIVNTTTEATPRSVANGMMVFATSSSSAIDGIAADADAPEQWWTVDGRALPAAPAAPGLYLRRQGSSTAKVLLPRP